MIRAALATAAVLLAAAICAAVVSAPREPSRTAVLAGVASAVKRAELVVSPRAPNPKQTAAAVAALRSRLSAAARGAVADADVAKALQGAKLVLEHDDGSSRPTAAQTSAAARALRSRLRVAGEPGVSQLGGARLAVVVVAALGLLGVALAAAYLGASGPAPRPGSPDVVGTQPQVGWRADGDRDALALACIELADALGGPDDAVARRLEHALGRGGVRPFTVSRGHSFDLARQQIVSPVSTFDAALDGRVADQLRQGWEADGRVLRPAQVTVYRRDGG